MGVRRKLGAIYPADTEENNGKIVQYSWCLGRDLKFVAVHYKPRDSGVK